MTLAQILYKTTTITQTHTHTHTHTEKAETQHQNNTKLITDLPGVSSSSESESCIS